MATDEFTMVPTTSYKALQRLAKGMRLRRAKNRSVIEWLRKGGASAGVPPLHHFSFAFLIKRNALERRIEFDGSEVFSITPAGRRLLKNAC